MLHMHLQSPLFFTDPLELVMTLLDHRRKWVTELGEDSKARRSGGVL